MAFNVVVGLSGLFLILISLGLTCFSEVANQGGLLYGVICMVLGVILLVSGMYLL